jgi:hypothetical protein
LKPTKNEEAGSRRTQNIYSVIQRKEGRLNELRNKGYVKERDKKWSLTKKGLIALNVKKPDLVTKKLQATKYTLLEQFKREVGSLPDDTVTHPFGIQIDFAKLKPALEKMNPTRLLAILLEETKALLLEGIELDRISEEDLLTLVMPRAALRRSENFSV